MRLKAGVRLLGMQPQIVMAALVAESVYQELVGHGVTITSCTDSRHRRGSRHYVGLALDLRTHDVPPELRVPVEERLREDLTDQFDVVLEADHYHIEWDPEV